MGNTVLRNLTVQSVHTASHQNPNHSLDDTLTNLVYNNMDNESFESSSNKVEDDAQTAFRSACKVGDSAAAKRLLKSMTNRIDRTVACEIELLSAVNDGRSEIVKFIVHQNKRLLLLGDSSGFPLLYRASKKGNENMSKVLIEAGADVNAKRSLSGGTALIIASLKGHAAICKLLIDAGADVDASNSAGVTALMYACFSTNCEAICKLIINAGANVDAKDPSGWTALMAASSVGNEAICKLLIDAGADVDASNNAGLTCFMIASDEGYEAICKLITMKRVNKMSLTNNEPSNVEPGDDTPCPDNILSTNTSSETTAMHPWLLGSHQFGNEDYERL